MEIFLGITSVIGFIMIFFCFFRLCDDIHTIKKILNKENK